MPDKMPRSWQEKGFVPFWIEVLTPVYIGSNDLRLINDDISYPIFYLDISDNPNIIFDATDVCSAWQAGQYFLYYDRTQDIIGCDAMLD